MPLTSMQQEYLLGCNHRWNVKTGATGSGKSFVDYSVTIPKRIMALKGEGLAVIIGNTRGTLERNILEPMRGIWGADLVGDIKSDNTVMLFGHKVYFLGADNKKHVARIQGATIEYCYGDEVTTWSRDVFEMLKSRLRCEHSHFDGTCNPDNPNHWFKKFLDSDADIFQQAYTIYDGCLPQKIVEELKKEYSGKVFYARYIDGLWAAAEGLVYDMFKTEANVIHEADTEGDTYVSCDYGIQNATVFLKWQKEKNTGKWVCINEWYYSGREQRIQKTDDELVDGLDDLCGSKKPKQVILDPSASSLKVLLRKRGYHVLDANNDVKDGISDVSLMLKTGQLLILDKCEHTIEEFGVYAWDEKAADNGEDKPLKVNDHCMDAVRYFVHTKRLTRKL